MADGGFLIKFDGKEFGRCYAVAFDYDEWKYKINNEKMKNFPDDVETITIEIERG